MERLKTAETQKEVPEDPHELDRRDRLRSRLEGMSAGGSFKGVSRTLSSIFHELQHITKCVICRFQLLSSKLHEIEFDDRVRDVQTIEFVTHYVDSNSYHLSCTRTCLPWGLSNVCHELYRLNVTNSMIEISRTVSYVHDLNCTREFQMCVTNSIF